MRFGHVVGQELITMESGDGWDYFDADGAREGDGHVAVDPNGFSDKDDWLISPRLVVETADSALSFYAKTGTITRVRITQTLWRFIYLQVDLPILISFTVVLDSVGNFSEEYIPFSYNLSDYVGDTIRTAIVYRGSYYGLSIDDIAGPKIKDIQMEILLLMYKL